MHYATVRKIKLIVAHSCRKYGMSNYKGCRVEPAILPDDDFAGIVSLSFKRKHLDIDPIFAQACNEVKEKLGVRITLFLEAST